MGRYMRLDGYIRVSRVGGREGETFISPDVQREQIENWAKLRGAEIIAWHVDLDQSGGKLERPGLDALMERIRSGQTEGMAVARLDRLSRAGVGDALKLVEELTERGAQLAAIDLGIDPTTVFGEFALTIMLALARMERRRIAESWASAQERAVARGVHISSACPTGYVRRTDGLLEPHPAFGAAIGEAFRMRAAGATWGEVVRLLEERGVVGPYGATRWNRKSVKGILSNRVYLGEARSGEFVKRGAHEALVDRMTFERVQEKPQTMVRGDGALLSGLLRCAGCGFALKADKQTSRSGERVRTYRCRGTNPVTPCEARTAVLGSVIEPRIEAWFLDWVGSVELAGGDDSGERDRAERALADAEAEVIAYRDATPVAIVGAESYRDGLETRAVAVDKARAALAKLPVVSLPSRAVLERTWPTLSIPERRRLLQAGVEVIFIRSGRTLPIEQRVAVFARGTWPADLPSPRRPYGPRTLIWERLPDRARMALAHDLGKDRGD